VENKKAAKDIKVFKFGAEKFSLQMYQNLLFEQPLDIRLAAFYFTPLGHLYQSIPFDNLAKQIQAPKKLPHGKGCKPGFDLKGGIALQILKSHFTLQRCYVSTTPQW
jgi:hypothetical protein